MPEKNGTGIRERAVTVTVTSPSLELTETFAPSGDSWIATLLASAAGSPLATIRAASREASAMRTWVKPSETIQSRRNANAKPNGAIVASSAVTMPRSRRFTERSPDRG